MSGPRSDPTSAAGRRLRLRVVSTDLAAQADASFPLGAEPLVIGRAPDCAVRLDDTRVSRHHARVEVQPSGPVLIDLESANGVYSGAQRVARLQLAPGVRFTVAGTTFEYEAGDQARDAADAEPAASERTLIMRAPAPEADDRAHARLRRAGHRLVVTDRQAALLDDPGSAYYVASGRIDLFTVTVDGTGTLGGRTHFAAVDAGGVAFGLEPRASHGTLLVALATAETELRQIGPEDVDALAREADTASTVAALVDGWVRVASARLARDAPRPPDTVVDLAAGMRATLTQDQGARAAEGVVWVHGDGDLTLAGLSPRPTVPGDGRSAALAVTVETWIETVAPAASPVSVEATDTAALVASGELQEGVRRFQDAVAHGVATGRRRSIAGEHERLGHKAREAEAALDEAFSELGAVLAARDDALPAGGAAGGLEPVLAACRLVGRRLGIAVQAPVEPEAAATLHEHVLAIAQASGFRARRVALRGDWWRTDAGPLVGASGAGAPVALLPRGPRAYTCVDAAARTEQPVTADLGNSLAPFAFALYRSLPAGSLRPRDLLRFAARGLAPDLRMLLGMGLLGGALGASIPLVAGQMIDYAIPQGDRRLLLQLGFAMLLVTCAGTALSVVKSIAVVRAETRMDAVLQAALWDRMLTLPTGFFRRFGAGDLADRAGGIDAIRRVLSTSGVGGLLSLVHAVAYLVLMLVISPALTVVAVAIAAAMVGLSAAGNYLLLRTARREFDLAGRIASLVLQLIAGVAKVRVSGAENHAFRVWAHRFADQKRLSFTLGRLQAGLATLTAGFQVLAPLVLFAAIYELASGTARPALTTGEFIAFYTAFGIFATSAQGLCAASLNLLMIVPLYERLRPILDAPPEAAGVQARPGPLKGEIAISRLHFRYRPDGPWVLENVNVVIRPGEFVALVGPSGCGKSTLLRLLLGFERPDAGSVSYDGLDLGKLDVRSVRRQFGVVLQGSGLLPTDIFRNIIGDSSRTVDDAWAAAEMAGLAEDLRRMPMGLHTMVSEGGGTLSGGQAQRLMIARALVASPRIVFFDEATSALDNKAQAVVTASLDRLDATRIVVAHRLSTVVNADRIIYLDGGRVREEGTYAELMASNGAFAQLARRQSA